MNSRPSGSRPSHRPERMADLVRQEVAQFMMTEIKDPRVGFLTITHVTMTKDLGLAKIYYTVYGNEKEKSETADALNASVGKLRTYLARNIRARTTPRIEFFFDEGLEESLKVQSLLEKLKK